jgi:hypothetical protein
MESNCLAKKIFSESLHSMLNFSQTCLVNFHPNKKNTKKETMKVRRVGLLE